MADSLLIPRVARPGDTGVVLNVTRVGMDSEGPFVVADGVRHRIPRELAKWAVLASALNVRGQIEFGWCPDRGGTREGGYYARVLDQAPFG